MLNIYLNLNDEKNHKEKNTMIDIDTRYVKTFTKDGTPAGQMFQRLSLDPSETALLLVDVYHGLQGDEDIEGVTGPDGERWYRTVDRIAIALNAARDCGLPVIYAINSAPRIALDRSEFGDHFRRSWGSDFDYNFREGGVDPREYHGGRRKPLAFPPELEPLPHEYYIRKHVYSAFFDTRLDTLLRNLGIKNLISAGFWADICMLATALDAFYRNYRVIWLRDGTLGDEQWVIPWFETAIGFTATINDFNNACSKLIPDK
jgi:nicotinamidase-related amidase